MGEVLNVEVIVEALPDGIEVLDAKTKASGVDGVAHSSGDDTPRLSQLGSVLQQLSTCSSRVPESRSSRSSSAIAYRHVQLRLTDEEEDAPKSVGDRMHVKSPQSDWMRKWHAFDSPGQLTGMSATCPSPLRTTISDVTPEDNAEWDSSLNSSPGCVSSGQKKARMCVFGSRSPLTGEIHQRQASDKRLNAIATKFKTPPPGFPPPPPPSSEISLRTHAQPERIEEEGDRSDFDHSSRNSASSLIATTESAAVAPSNAVAASCTSSSVNDAVVEVESAALAAANEEAAQLRTQLARMQAKMDEMNEQLEYIRTARPRREIHFSCTLSIRKRPLLNLSSKGTC